MSGWDIIATREEPTSMVCEPARFASERSSVGEVVLSFVAPGLRGSSQRAPAVPGLSLCGQSALYSASTRAILRGSSAMCGPMRFMT